VKTVQQIVEEIGLDEETVRGVIGELEKRGHFQKVQDLRPQLLDAIAAFTHYIGCEPIVHSTGKVSWHPDGDEDKPLLVVITYDPQSVRVRFNPGDIGLFVSKMVCCAVLGYCVMNGIECQEMENLG
jgi:hypothetical protein